MTATPTDSLIAQTTTAVPSVVIIPVMVASWIVLLYRMCVIRDRRPTVTAAHWYALFILTYATLRIGPLHQFVTEWTPLRLGDVRVAGGILQICSATALLLLALRWRSRTGTTTNRVWTACSVNVCILSVLLIIVHIPASSAEVAVEEMSGSWRTGAYLTLHSFMYFPAEALIALTLAQMARFGSLRRRVLAGLLSLAIALSAVNLLTVIGGGWLISAGIEGPWSTPRSSVRNDFALYPTLIPWMIAGIPGVFTHMFDSFGLNRKKRARVQALVPLWEFLTDVAPEYRLATSNQAVALPSMTEREHRIRTEIEDIIFAVSRSLPPERVWPDNAEGRVELLTEACSTYVLADGRARRGGPIPEWAVEDAAVDQVADAWKAVRVMAASS